MIPLVRDVPLDVHVDDLVLGGWHHEAARAAFAQLELKGAWGRFDSALREGMLGAPAEGELVDAVVISEVPPAPVDDPTWLATPEAVVPTSVATACTALEELFATTRAGTGVVALAPMWEGDPGRSPLLGLALVAEPADPAESSAAVYLGPISGGPLVGEADVLTALSAGLGTDGVGVVAHDIKELMRSLLPLGVDISGLVVDTAVAAYLLDPSVDEYRLSDLGARYLQVAVDDGTAAKGQGSFTLESETNAENSSDEPVLDAVGLRLVRLAAVAARLRAPLLDDLDAVGERKLFDDMERPLVRVLARMEVVGIAVDREVLRTIANELTTECASLEATMHELAGSPFNVNSVKQLRTVLYDDLGLSPGRKTKTGYSTDARTLESLRDQHPIIDVLLRYREVEKLRSTYGESLAAEVGSDGRIHATFRQTVARTGRLSSDRPNLHNIPVRTDEGRRFRQAFVPSPGRRLLVADYDQVELRAIAHLSGDPGLTSAFAAGEDIHRTVAARVFGVDRDEVTHEQRSRAKMVSYGLAYGMESYGLAQRLGVSVEEAKVILDAFFDGFPLVHDYMDSAVALARTDGYTVTTFGRRRPLPDLLSSNHQVRQAAERQAMNAGIQGLAADLFKMALIRLDSGLEEGGYRSDLVLQVHDEVLVDVDPDEADAVEALTESALTGAAELLVPLKVAMAWGSSWAEAKG